MSGWTVLLVVVIEMILVAIGATLWQWGRERSY